MLTLQQIKADPKEVVRRLAVKGFDGQEPIARAIALDDRRRQLQLENDNRAASLNKRYAKEFGDEFTSLGRKKIIPPQGLIYLIISAFLFKQLIMTSSFYNLSFFKHHYSLRVSDRR